MGGETHLPAARSRCGGLIGGSEGTSWPALSGPSGSDAFVRCAQLSEILILRRARRRRSRRQDVAARRVSSCLLVVLFAV